MDTENLQSSIATPVWKIIIEFLELFLVPHITYPLILLATLLYFRRAGSVLITSLAGRLKSGAPVSIKTPMGSLEIKERVGDAKKFALLGAGSISDTGQSLQASAELSADYSLENLAETSIKVTSEEGVVEKYEELMNVTPSPLLLPTEENIFNLLKTKGLDVSSDAVKVLVRNYSSVVLDLNFERDYAAIRGSEIELLELMNVRIPIPYSVPELDNHILTKAKIFPDVFSNMSVSKYLGWMLSKTLVLPIEKGFGITVRGQAFLLWMINNNKSKTRLY